MLVLDVGQQPGILADTETEKGLIFLAAAGHVRIEDAGITKGAVFFQVNTAGIDPTQRHAVGALALGAQPGRAIQFVNHPAGRLTETVGCELQPLVMRQVRGEQGITLQQAHPLGRVKGMLILSQTQFGREKDQTRHHDQTKNFHVETSI